VVVKTGAAAVEVRVKRSPEARWIASSNTCALVLRVDRSTDDARLTAMSTNLRRRGGGKTGTTVGVEGPVKRRPEALCRKPFDTFAAHPPLAQPTARYAHSHAFHTYERGESSVSKEGGGRERE
jgi:hypothetical protein